MTPTNIINYSELSLISTQEILTASFIDEYCWPSPEVYFNKENTTVLMSRNTGEYHWDSIEISNIPHIVGVFNFNMPSRGMVMSFVVDNLCDHERNDSVSLTFIGYDFVQTALTADKGAHLAHSLKTSINHQHNTPVHLFCLGDGLFWLMQNIYHGHERVSL